MAEMTGKTNGPPMKTYLILMKLKTRPGSSGIMALTGDGELSELYTGVLRLCSRKPAMDTGIKPT